MKTNKNINMKRTILTLIIAAAALAVSADGLSLQQMRKAGKQARLEANRDLKAGKRIGHYRTADYRKLQMAAGRAASKKEETCIKIKIIITIKQK